MSSKNGKYKHELDNIVIYADFVKRGSMCSSVEISWGGLAKFDESTMKKDFSNYNVFIKRLFHSHIKDGYFNNKIIYINNLNDNMKKTFEGTLFAKVFLHLEEEYEKTFVLDYLQTIYAELDEYHKNHTTISFKKYPKHRNGVKNN